MKLNMKLANIAIILLLAISGEVHGTRLKKIENL